jgi:hypothetical protein
MWWHTTAGAAGGAATAAAGKKRERDYDREEEHISNKTLRSKVTKLKKKNIMAELQYGELMESYDDLNKKHDDLENMNTSLRKRLAASQTQLWQHKNKIDAVARLVTE